MELSDALAAAIALEEHRQGMPYDGDASHCGECGSEASRRRQAACPHDDVDEIGAWGGGLIRRICAACGLSWEAQ